jgi:tetratricopeptide (TPR) repeat protein
MTSRRLALAAVLGCAACATRLSVTRPAGAAWNALGGSANWAEFRTAHFILDTDAPDDQVALMLTRLERLRAGDLQVLAGGDVELPGHIRVFAPASLPGIFSEVAGNWNEIFYTRGPYSEPVLLAPVSWFLEEPESVAHELAHAVSSYLFPEQPRWFAEGIAQFVQTLASKGGESAIVARDSQVRHATFPPASVGGLPEDFLTFDAGLGMPGADLINWQGEDETESYRIYSWLLYHWLWNTRGVELNAFQKQLANGDDPQKAWLSHFPDLDPSNAGQMDALDAELFAYRREGKFVMAKIEAKAEYKAEYHPVSPGDVRAWLLRLRQEKPQQKEERAQVRRRELAKARAEDPSNPWVLQQQASFEGKFTPETARAAAQGAADDFRGWYALSVATADPAEKERAARKAVELGGECAACNNQLAWILATSGRAKEALAFADRALDLSPWDASALETLAEVAVQVGKCPEAVQLQSRAARMEIAAGQPKDATEARLTKLKARCTGK